MCSALSHNNRSPCRMCSALSHNNRSPCRMCSALSHNNRSPYRMCFGSVSCLLFQIRTELEARARCKCTEQLVNSQPLLLALEFDTQYVRWLMVHCPLWQLRTHPAIRPAPTLHHPYPHYISLSPVHFPCRTNSVQSIKFQPFLHHPLIYAFVGLSLLLRLKQQSIIYLIASRSRRLTSDVEKS